MGELKVNKQVLSYVKPHFENNSFEIIEEDNSHFLFYYNEDITAVPLKISNKEGYLPGKNQYRLRIKIARRNLKMIKEVFSANNIAPSEYDNLIFLFLYIQAGINSYPEWLLINQVHRWNISNFAKAILISREHIQDVSIIIKSKTQTATFENLNWSGPILEKMLELISSSFQLSPNEERVAKIINDPSITNSELKSLIRDFEKLKAVDHHDYLINVAICVIINYLNNRQILTRKNVKTVSGKQLKMISDILQINEMIPFQELDNETHLKNLGQRVRDFLKKLDCKLADFAPTSPSDF